MKQTLEFSDPFSEIRPANLTNHMCLLTERYNNVCTRLQCSHLHVTKRYELLGVAHTKKKQIQATISQFFRCKDHSSSMFGTNFNEFKSVHYKTIKTRVNAGMKRTESQKKEHEKREALFENGKTNAIPYFFRNEIEN